MDTTHVFASFASAIVFFGIIISGLSNLGLGIYVYKNNPQKRLNRNFAVLAFINFLFCLVNTVNNLAIDNTFWLRICYAVGTLAAVGCFFLGIAVANIQIKKSTKIMLYLATSIMTLACLTPYVIKKISEYTVLGWQAEFGPLFVVWVIFTIFIFCLSVYLPMREMKNLDERSKKQFTYFVSGYFIFGTWSLLFGVIFPLFGFSSIANIDTPSTLFVTVFTSYAIIKYQLMDIKSLFFKAFVYSLIIAGISGILVIIVFLESWFYYNLGSSATYFIFLCVSIAIFLVGRSFYKKTKDIEIAKNNLAELLKISERNRLRAEEEKNKTLTIINNFSDSLIILDEKEKIAILNPEAEKILNIKAGDALGKTIHEMESNPNFNVISSYLPADDTEITKKEIEIKDDLILEFSSVKLIFEKKRMGKLLILHDITRGKIVEKLKTEFVTLSAHQLRTPLTGIKWTLNMLLNGDLGNISQEQREYIEKANVNTAHTINLIHELLDITHIEEGKYVHKFSKFKIEEVFLTALSNIKKEIDDRRIKINYELPSPEIPLLTADREKIEIVIQNLLENAIKYSPDGGQVIVNIEKDGLNFIFKVTDFGIGIPENQKNRIFEKFYRGENAFVKETEGSGIGLYMSKNIIESHGGQIGFESVEKKGSTFYFSIPFDAKLKQ